MHVPQDSMLTKIWKKFAIFFWTKQGLTRLKLLIGFLLCWTRNYYLGNKKKDEYRERSSSKIANATNSTNAREDPPRSGVGHLVGAFHVPDDVAAKELSQAARPRCARRRRRHLNRWGTSRRRRAQEPGGATGHRRVRAIEGNGGGDSSWER